MSLATLAPVAEATQPSLQHLVAHCNAYKTASTKRALIQLAITASAFLFLSAALCFNVAEGAYLGAAMLLLPAALFLVRMFIIQHDCGHNSFTPSRQLNNAIGRAISLLTFTPYDYWRKAHNLHHAHSGNLSARGLGAIDTLTVAEFNALSRWEQMIYRIFRNPLVVLFLGPPLQTFIIQRFPPAQTTPYMKNYHPMTKDETRKSIMLSNLSLVLFYGAAIALFGWKPVVLGYFPIVVVTSWIGGWLFFIQHQFENTYWNYNGTWSYNEAALLSSSYYVLPKAMQWFSGSIGIHHIHHLCAKIPNYRLQECLDGNEELQQMNRLTFRESLKCAQWALWDESKRRMIRFKDLQAA